METKRVWFWPVARMRVPKWPTTIKSPHDFGRNGFYSFCISNHGHPRKSSVYLTPVNIHFMVFEGGLY